MPAASVNERTADEAVIGNDDVDTFVAAMSQAEDTAPQKNVQGPNKSKSMAATMEKELLDLYHGAPEGARHLARAAYPWLVRRWKECEDKRFVFLGVTASGAPGVTHAINSNSHLAPPLVALHYIDGCRIHGMELLIAIALHINSKLAPYIETAIRDDTVIPVLAMDSISMGDPHETEACGVYGLRKGNKAIVGMTVSQGFRERVGSDPYSHANKVVKEFGETNQHHGRIDNIIFNVSSWLQQKVTSPALFIRGLETFGILAFGTVLGGLNSRLADPWLGVAINGDGLKALWDGLWATIEEGHKVPACSEDYFRPYYDEYLRPYAPEGQSFFWARRMIWAMSALADTGRYPSFEPLPPDAFMCARPRLAKTDISYRGIANSSKERPHGRLSGRFTIDEDHKEFCLALPVQHICRLVREHGYKIGSTSSKGMSHATNRSIVGDRMAAMESSTLLKKSIKKK